MNGRPKTKKQKNPPKIIINALVNWKKRYENIIYFCYLKMGYNIKMTVFFPPIHNKMKERKSNTNGWAGWVTLEIHDKLKSLPNTNPPILITLKSSKILTIHCEMWGTDLEARRERLEPESLQSFSQCHQEQRCLQSPHFTHLCATNSTFPSMNVVLSQH